MKADWAVSRNQCLGNPAIPSTRSVEPSLSSFFFWLGHVPRCKVRQSRMYFCSDRCRFGELCVASVAELVWCDIQCVLNFVCCGCAKEQQIYKKRSTESNEINYLLMCFRDVCVTIPPPFSSFSWTARHKFKFWIYNHNHFLNMNNQRN